MEMRATVVACFWASLLIAVVGCHREELTVRYWRTDPIPSSSPRVFPERQDDPTLAVDRIKSGACPIGVCFAGGGTRSASATLGQLRELRQTGLLDRVGYISCVSGGSWAAVPFTFVSPDKDDDFLGPYIDPGHLQISDLQENEPDRKHVSLAAALCDTSLPNWAELAPRIVFGWIGIRDKDYFANQLRRAILEPFGLAEPRRFVTQNEASMRALIQRNPKLDRRDFALPDPRRPFLIVNGTLRRYDLWPWDWANAHNKRMPLEMTPLYVGVPHTFRDVRENGRSVGGTYLESAGYGSQDVQDVSESTIHATLQSTNFTEESWRFDLADMMAISGSAPAEVRILADGAFLNLPIWSADNWTKTKQMPLDSYYHADGGTSEDLGIMPLLARRVTRIIAFVNAEDRGVPDYVRELFGQQTGDPASLTDLGNWHSRGVFPAQKLQDLQVAMANCANGGLPFLLDTYRVHAPAENNSEDCFNLHLRPGEVYDVKVAWFFLEDTAWRNALDEKQGVANWMDHNSDFDNFPRYKTFLNRPWHIIQPTMPQVKALAFMTSWLVEKEAPAIQAYFNLDDAAGKHN